MLLKEFFEDFKFIYESKNEDLALKAISDLIKSIYPINLNNYKKVERIEKDISLTLKVLYEKDHKLKSGEDIYTYILKSALRYVKIELDEDP